MKILLYILLSLHGLIHLFGFLHAFRIYEFPAFTQAISKPWGLLWLLCFVAFGLTLVSLARGDYYWWAIGGFAVVLSQVLIFAHWQDAKVGTIPNLLILLVCMISYLSYHFADQVQQERTHLSSNSELLVSPQPLDSLPTPVRKWLVNSGVGEEDVLQNVYLEQHVKMKLKPETKDWSLARATQFFTVNPPAFNWAVNLSMNPLVSVQGRDQFVEGQGAMLMKIWSAIPVVDVQANEQINEAALQRFLAEIVWFPAAARSPYLEWEAIDEQRARATMTYRGTTGSGVFHFAANGDFGRFSTLRYKDTFPGAEKQEWVAEVLEYGTLNGVRVPVKLQIIWKLEDQDWTWLEVEVTDLKYNVETLPARPMDYK